MSMFNLLDFVYDNCLFKQFKINETLFIEYKCVADESIAKVWSMHNYFVYVMSGKKIWQTINQKYVINKGEAIFVKKGANIIHQFFNKDFCALIIFVPDEYISEVIQCNGTSEVKDPSIASDSVIPIHLNAVLEIFFHSVFAYFQNEKQPPKNLLEIKFKELILDLISFPHNEILRDYFNSLCRKRKTSMREIMESNFTYHLTLEEFARLSGRSLTTFKRDFEETFNTSPGKWLTRRKLEYAKHLLETTDKNVNDLTFESGFENVSHFIRTFKQTFGLPPLKFKTSGIPPREKQT